MIILFPKIVEKLQRIDQLIRMKATGSPQELAKRLGLAPSTIYQYLDIMKNVLNAPIKYCVHKRSYIYEEDVRLFIGFKNRNNINNI
jgi:ACT domain-containing protein